MTMGKNILIFADGTGNVGGLLPDESRTNVYKLYRATRTGPESPIDPSKQIAFYVPGIGTPSPRHSSKQRRIRETLQQAVGAGLTQKIVDCYVAIIGLWEPCDRIYLFGFSRGAYTVRCLAHVLELVGIPTAISLEPTTLRAIARSGVDVLYRWGLPRSNVNQRNADAATFVARHECVTGADSGALPYFIGVWDTVAALGWTRFLHRQYDEHFPKDVPYARHAMAIDEFRSDFVRVPWGGSKTVSYETRDGLQRFDQVWFSGNHQDIGGSYPENESRLSDIPLKWMADLIEKELPPEGRVVVNRDILNCFPSAAGMMHDECMVGVEGIRFLRWSQMDREVPQDATLHDTVYERLKMDRVRNFVTYGKYRPASLRNHTRAKLYFTDVMPSPIQS
jgi:uncharacterized protein (DUF2235 family)